MTATVRNTFLAVYRNCAGLEPDERLVHAVAAANRAVNRRVLSGTEGDRDANAVWLTDVAITENAIYYVGIGQGLIAIIETEESHVLRSGGSGERRAAQPALVGTAIRPTNLNVGRTMPSIDRDHFLVLGASGYNHLSPKELNEASRRDQEDTTLRHERHPGFPGGNYREPRRWRHTGNHRARLTHDQPSIHCRQAGQ